jgi:hypothetical protein
LRSQQFAFGMDPIREIGPHTEKTCEFTIDIHIRGTVAFIVGDPIPFEKAVVSLPMENSLEGCSGIPETSKNTSH